MKFFTNKYVVVLIALICCLLWGSAFPFVKLGYSLFGIGSGNSWGQILFAGYRFLFAGLLLMGIAVVSRQDLRVPKGSLKHLVGLGLILTTGQYIFFYLGLARTNGINAAILNSTTVFFSIILAHFFLANDRINSKKGLGLVLGFAGVILSNYSPELTKVRISITGDGFIILSQLAAAIGAIYVKKISGLFSAIVLTSYQMIIGALFLIIPAALQLGLFPFHYSIKGLLILTYLFILSAAAFSLWNTLIKYNPVGKIAVFQFMIPVFGTLLSALILSGEKLTVFNFVALILVSSGIFITYGIDALRSKSVEAEEA